jgi:hypothetical protein
MFVGYISCTLPSGNLTSFDKNPCLIELGCFPDLFEIIQGYIPHLLLATSGNPPSKRDKLQHQQAGVSNRPTHGGLFTWCAQSPL